MEAMASTGWDLRQLEKKIVEHSSRAVTRVDDEMIVLDACLKMVKHAKKI
jgi:hypothetical protein